MRHEYCQIVKIGGRKIVEPRCVKHNAKSEEDIANLGIQIELDETREKLILLRRYGSEPL